MIDKNGKKLQVGSVIAIQKPGCEKFTVKGVVEKLEEDILWFREDRRGFLRPAKYTDVKRVKYRPRDVGRNFRRRRKA